VIIEARNSFERSGRFAKVAALVMQIDALCRGPKRRAMLDPIRDGEKLAAIVEGWTPEQRRKCAILANVIPKSGKLPSGETWAGVTSFLRERAQKAAS